jgi:hypothetical protein
MDHLRAFEVLSSAKVIRMKDDLACAMWLVVHNVACIIELLSNQIGQKEIHQSESAALSTD